jgi:glycosyltransferase involved in cell wall biosynthesis
MRILYIGNKLSKYGKTLTTVETLGKQLEEYYDIVTVSDKSNKALRMLDVAWSIVKNRGVDYVLIDTYSSSNFYVAAVAASLCRLYKIKYIPILHGGNLPQRIEQWPKVSKRIFDNSYINVSPSGYLNYEFKHHGYENVVTIPNNIFMKDYTFKERNTFLPRLLWVRSFDKTYNCEMAVEVLRLLVEKFPDAELCMVGPDKDGSMQTVKDLAAQYGLTGRLKITGKMSKPDWHKLSEKYDIFISTTNFDNTPVSVIEAMALGLPVVSTNVGGVPYLIDDGKDGLLCEKGNAEDMAEKILQLISSPEKSKDICINARRKVESFDWEVVKEQWKELLK